MADGCFRAQYVENVLSFALTGSDLCPCSELALAHLLQGFRFEHDDAQRIKWMYASTTFPVVIGEEAMGPQLPLKVSELTT